MNNSPPYSNPATVLAYSVVMNTDEKPVSTKKSQSVKKFSKYEIKGKTTAMIIKMRMNLFLNMLYPSIKFNCAHCH